MFSKCVLGEIQWRSIEIILRHFQNLSQPNFSWNLIILPKTFSNCLLAQIHLHGTKNVLRFFQNVSKAKFNGILLNLFLDIFRLCLSRNSVEPYWNYSKTFSNCLLAQIHLYGTEDVVRPFQNVSQAKLKRIFLKFFWDIFKLWHSRISVVFYWN